MGARPETYTLESSPSGAEVWLHLATAPGALNAASAPAQPSFVGKTGQPMQLDLEPFVGKTNGRLEVLFTLKLPGHASVEVRPDNDFLRTHKWGPVPLQAQDGVTALRDFVATHRLLTLLGLGAVGLGVVGGAAFWRQRRALQAAREREQQRETLLVSAANDPMIGKKLGRYLVVSRLGSGGMAIVYRAVPESTLDDSQAVAIKVVSPTIGNDPEFAERFLREVQTYQSLNHPNIVRIVEWGDGEPMFLAMELIDGPNLRQCIQAGGLPLDEVLALMYPMLGALAYAHARGIVHRDLKPENVMLAPGPLVKVMDFGLARQREVSRRLTATGTALGTPDYMSPEQINGATDPASDQYALGMIFYELLTGRLPFEGDIMGILMAHMSETPPRVSLYREKVPAAIEAMVARMIDRDVSRRYDSLEDILTELEALYPGLAQWRKRSDPFPAGTFDNLLR